jgi:hypothetical protein
VRGANLVYVARAALAPCAATAPAGGRAGPDAGVELAEGEEEVTEEAWVALRIAPPPASSNEMLLLWCDPPLGRFPPGGIKVVLSSKVVLSGAVHEAEVALCGAEGRGGAEAAGLEGCVRATGEAEAEEEGAEVSVAALLERALVWRALLARCSPPLPCARPPRPSAGQPVRAF